jgi:uncharacterized repeat protein (TIGR03803 family)
MSASHFARLVFGSIFAGALAISVLNVAAQGQTPTTVYAFTEPPGPLNPDNQAITQGRDGELYLWAAGGDGGAQNCTVTYCGELFKISTTGTVTDLFDQSNNNCSAIYCGNGTYGGLTLGTDGNFYGATLYGGTTGNNGTIFKMTSTGTVTPLYNFTGGSDGSHPYASPIEAANGTFYGTTSAQTLNSTAYSITSSGTFKTLHTFTGSDGQAVYAPLVQGTDGNFYGTASAGGTTNNGVIFKMTSSGAVTVLHNFTGADGSTPYYQLIQATDGNFYGVAYNGGTSGAGVIFKITSSGTYTVLHNLNGTTDGQNPAFALVQATNGKLYGVTAGSNISGTIYSITTSGTFTSLYTFTGGSDGNYPLSPMVQHTDGLLYGTTDIGGNVNTCSTDISEQIYLGCGTVFSLNIGTKAFIKLQATSGNVGSKVGIFGQGFSSSSVVKFNGVAAAKPTLTGTTYLTATVPTGATDGFVTVTTGKSTLTSTQLFTVHNSWASGAVMTTGTVRSSAAVLEGSIYVIGGVNASGTVIDNVQIYNPTTNTWSSGTALPTVTENSSAAVVNNVLYVFGGDNGVTAPTNAVWAYSTKTKAWTSMAAMPTARNGTLAVVEKNIVYVMGGNLGNGANFVATVESYNPATNTWTEETPMDSAKDFPAGGLIGTTIVAADGAPSGSVVTGDTESYNAATNEWSELTADPTARTGPCSGVIGSTLYDASGYINNGGAATTVNESYNLSTNKWTTTLLAIPQGTMYPAAAVDNGQLYCLGGWGVLNSTAINNVQIYQP